MKGPFREVNERRGRKRDVRKSIRDTLSNFFSQVAAVEGSGNGFGEEGLDFEARDRLNRGGRGSAMARNARADKGSDALIRMSAARGVEEVETERRSVKDMWSNHIVRERELRGASSRV